MILETIKRKWAEYLIEVLVIMIGILGAFMLNSWNESRRLEMERQGLIASLIEDFEFNSMTIKEQKMPISADRLATMNKFYDLLNSEEQPVDIDSMRNLAVVFFQFESFQPNLTAYNTANSSGALTLLENKKLLEEFTAFMEALTMIKMVQSQGAAAYYSGSSWEFRKTLIPGVIYNSRFSGTYKSDLSFNEYKDLMTTPLALNAFHNAYVFEGNNSELLTKLLEHSDRSLELLYEMRD